MNIARNLLIVFALTLFFTPVFAQPEKKLTKKQQAMVDWYAAEEKKEKYVVMMEEAHKLFQQKNFGEAQKRYEAALEIAPGDQQAIAKITDLQVIIDSIASSNPAPTQTVIAEKVEVEEKKATVVESIPDPEPEVVVVKKEEVPVVQQKITPEPLVEKVEEKVEPKASETKTAVETKPTRTVKPKPKPVVSKVDKTSPEFQMELAKQYPEGWTEEIFREGTKQFNKRVFVAGGKGTEYIKVVHDWGGIYHFRNGTPITADLWKEETSGLSK